MKYPSLIGTAAAILLGSALLANAAVRGHTNGSDTQPLTPDGTVLGSASLWAVINADGTISRSDGAAATTTSRIAIGAYQVGFFRRVHVCAYTASIGNPAAGNPAHGTIVVATRAGNNNAVFVETRDTTGALFDSPFHLLVTC